MELRIGYGFAAFGERFRSTPEFGLGLSNGRREYRLGWRLNLAERGPAAVDLSLKAIRRESIGGKPEHGFGVRFTGRW